jgi:hypothetical protein
VEERVDVMMKNARQLRGIVSATYPEFEHLSVELRDTWKKKPCNELASEAEELACLWGQASSIYKVWPAKETLDFLVQVLSHASVRSIQAKKRSSFAAGIRINCLEWLATMICD